MPRLQESLGIPSFTAEKPTTIAEMRVAIEEECAQIPLEMLLDVCKSISSRYEKCIGQNGKPV